MFMVLRYGFFQKIQVVDFADRKRQLPLIDTKDVIDFFTQCWFGRRLKNIQLDDICQAVRKW